MKIIAHLIVKNEAPVILRCLDSILPHINGLVVVDTGSTDGTQHIIIDRLTAANLERWLVDERPWVNFAHNRNQALQMARSLFPGEDDVWALTIDADEELVEGAEMHGYDQNNLDGIYLPIRYGELRYDRMALVRLSEPWRWEGAVHEVLVHPNPQTYRLHGPMHILARKEGCRSRDPEAYNKDVELLAKGDLDDPRTAYYYAQSLHSAGRLSEALQAFMHRAKLQGWDEERWHAVYSAAQVIEKLKQPQAQVTAAYLQAFQLRPSRAEPLVNLCRYLTEQKAFALAMVYGLMATTAQKTDDKLFVEPTRWKALDLTAVAAFYAGRRDIGAACMKQLLEQNEFPDPERARITKNGEFFTVKAE